MNPNDNDDSRSVALYWNFENLHAGLMEAKYGEGAYTPSRTTASRSRNHSSTSRPWSNSARPSALSPSTVPTATGSTSAATGMRSFEAPSN